jgi:hypothetical protein
MAQAAKDIRSRTRLLEFRRAVPGGAVDSMCASPDSAKGGCIHREEEFLRAEKPTLRPKDSVELKAGIEQRIKSSRHLLFERFKWSGDQLLRH